ncbi:MAG: aldo/keto reductase [Chloroflexi bacterium]|nr:aldo/keto reductase [Chloroflexota bacterium]
MKYRRLGNSGLLVSELCLGTMIFGEGSERSTPPDEAARMIDRYLDAGGNHIDTANVYADGRSEEIVGKAIKNRRSQIVLATKVRFPRGEGPNEVGLSRHHIMQAVHASLRRLDTDYIDLYYMHGWDPMTPLEESLRAFDDLVTAGKIRYIGVSNFKAWQVMKALGISEAHNWVRYVGAQYQYSLVTRDIELELTEMFQHEGLGLMPWGALGGGFLSGKYKRGERPGSAQDGRIAVTPVEWEEAWERRNTERNWNIIDAVGKIAEERNATYSQIALAWVLHQPTVASLIIGARTISQLEDNLGSANIALTDTELETLERVSALPELYPYRIYAIQYQSRDPKAH